MLALQTWGLAAAPVSGKAAGLLVALVFLSGCEGSRPEVLELAGGTMGTQYSIQVVGMPEAIDRARLADEIQAELASVNALMSTWDPESELSRFNRYQGDDWFGVSDQTARVMAKASAVSQVTGGAFDVTVGPLVNLWGFGPDARPESVPSDDRIAAAAARVGFNLIEVRDSPPALRKRRPDVYADLSAIAKGYGVDRVAGILDAMSIRSYLVDIGGEVRMAGMSPRGGPWRLAVEDPRSVDRVPVTVIELQDAAVATSGNYRNFFEHEGVRYAHTIDPRTGWPVTHGLLSVTVVAEDTMTADAWATALMVLGPVEGMAVAERAGLAVIFLTERDGRIHKEATPALRRLTEKGD